MNKKAYVYDTSKGFSAFIKYNYSSKLNIFSCTKKKNFSVEKITDYNVCFFVVNDMEDFFNLKRIYFDIEFFFVGSPNKLILKKIEDLKYDDLMILDFYDSKYNILQFINIELLSKSIL
ncbi:hypothetical protein [Flavobacterium chungnamense]|uniref:IPExxxVDY family protein n=1 Tax=Flavobacterium chungnamense TaxID=706182 RepID=A0ABP7ULM9_9FLAO